MGSHMLLVSSDYDYNSASSNNGATPKNKSGTKRSREDLNMKEKKRMFKLNDRINQLKDMLEAAGVQTKKNKQSILDNASYFIDQLQSDLMIAKQKAERAEKEAEQLKLKSQKSGKGSDASDLFKDFFHQSTMARVVVDTSLQLVTLNDAFVRLSGHTQSYLHKKDNVRTCICADQAKLKAIVSKVCDTKAPVSSVVTSKVSKRSIEVTLMASPVSDASGNTSHVEFSLIPVEAPSETSSAKEPEAETATTVPAKTKVECSTDSDTSTESFVV
ncbi:hypothetical protein PINS_up007698 [Pythium insidiosum]|nr:hypothetical protein PINS_up007698 [Pythium insidiosum]